MNGRTIGTLRVIKHELFFLYFSSFIIFTYERKKARARVHVIQKSYTNIGGFFALSERVFN